MVGTCIDIRVLEEVTRSRSPSLCSQSFFKMRIGMIRYSESSAVEGFHNL
ncbi:MAG: hypothetical protein KME55_04845 [Nostoc indistinguendum CM1-VF10]|nr:hypothetical protein [Nostoc indistinguendum CM1-VF10]